MPADAIHSRLCLPAAFALPPIPPGMEARPADLLLRRAEARMHLCRLWAQTRPLLEPLRREQQAFHRDIDAANGLIAQLQRLGTVDTTQLAQRSRQVARDNARLAAAGKYATAAMHTFALPGTGLAGARRYAARLAGERCH